MSSKTETLITRKTVAKSDTSKIVKWAVGAVVAFAVLVGLIFLIRYIVSKYKKPKECGAKNPTGTCATTGYKCNNGTCAKACTLANVATDCTGTQDCVEGYCKERLGTCSAAMIETCKKNNQDCVGGRCFDRTCTADLINTCKSSGQICSGGRCVPCQPGSADCGVGSYCDAGVCKTGNAPYSYNPFAPPCQPECGAGSYCDAGVCKTGTAPS